MCIIIFVPMCQRKLKFPSFMVLFEFWKVVVTPSRGRLGGVESQPDWLLSMAKGNSKKNEKNQKKIKLLRHFAPTRYFGRICHEFSNQHDTLAHREILRPCQKTSET